MPKRKSTSIIVSNATDGLNTELVVEPVISPVSVLSNNATLASLVEDTTTTITSIGSVASAKQNNTQTTTNDDEEMSAEYSAPSAPSFVSTVSNTPSFATNDDESSLVVIEEEEVVEEVAVSQQSQESWILSPTNSISTDMDASPTEASSDSAPDVADDPGQANALREGTFVRIISNGKYKGKVGIVSRMTEKMVYVTIEGIDRDPRISKANVEVVGEEQSSQAAARSTSSTPTVSTSTKTKNNTESESSTPFELGQTIAVINENSDYYGKQGTIVKVNNKMLRVSIDGVGEKSLSKKSAEILLTSTPKANQPSSIFRTSCSPNDLQVEIPLGCDTGISSISLATGIVTPTNNMQQIDTDVVIPSPRNSTSSSTSESQSATTFGQGAQLIIKAGKYKGKTAILVKTLPRSLKVAIDGQEVTVRKTSVFGHDNRVSKSLTSRNSAGTGRSARSSRNSLSAAIGGSGEDWKVPDSTGGGTRFGGRIIQKIRISKKSVGYDNNFLSHFLGDRIKIVEVPLDSGEATDSFDSTVLEDGRAYELMSVKIREDNNGPSMQYCKKQCAHLIYCQTRGPCLEPINVEKELSKLADFSGLSPRKAMSRLELLQSPALKLSKGRPGIFFLNAKEACEIDDNGNDGCGFIDEAFLSSLLPGSKYRDTLAIQIRILAPSMGLFKGMLMRRRIVEGPPIQLTPTMKKVAASRSNTSDGRACLVITQAGKNPSPLNQYIGRMIDPTLKPPPKKSFNDMLKQKPLNKKRLKDKVDMIPRLLLALGAQTPSLEIYLKESLTMSGLAHAYVVGVADPTYAIPAGFVFVTGFSNVSTPNGQIFVTRSPCAKASDARMIPMVRSKPDEMAQLDWDWLNSLPFGAIIFANPKKGIEPLPAQIASGDLDGDRYFILWDRAILQQVKTDPIVENAIVEEEDGNEKNDKKPNHNWLKEAQQLMVDSASIQDLGALTGCLYKLAEKTADASNLYMRDPDAIAFANAYNQALEYGKHGGKINLPDHLHAEVPARLRKHLSYSK